MTRGADRRLALYKPFAGNYEAWTGIKGRVACPICLAEGSLEDITAGHFDLGHIAPKRLQPYGPCVLLCRTCNGRNGGLFDELLVQHTQLGLRPGERLGKAKVGRSTARVAVSGGRRPERVRFVRDDHASRRMVQSWTRARLAGVPVTISVGKDPSRRLAVAHLSIAYLTLVKYYLYAPVFMPAMDRVRQQITRPDDEILPNVFVSEAKAGAWGIYEDYGPLALPAEPRSLRCLIVRALDKTVMLPLAVPGDVIYARLKQLVDYSPSPKPDIEVEYGNITIPYVKEMFRPGMSGQRFQLWRTEDGGREAIIGGRGAEDRAAETGRSRTAAPGARVAPPS